MNARCQFCNIDLPACTPGPWCDDHEDDHEGETPEPTPEPEKPMRVVHNGLISKRNGGLEDVER